MVYHGNKKKKGVSPGRHPYTPEDMKRINWCLKKGISIVLNSSNEGVDRWQVEIRMNNKSHVDPKLYSGYDALGKMYEYYKYYYDRNSN